MRWAAVAALDAGPLSLKGAHFIVKRDEFKRARERSVPRSTPHNTALDINPRDVELHIFDSNGLWVCAKRLEKGRFRWPDTEGRHSVTMRSEELAMLVNGLDAKQTRQRNWYRKSACKNSRI